MQEGLKHKELEAAVQAARTEQLDFHICTSFVNLSELWKIREVEFRANFFSGISHVTAYLLPIMLLSLWPHISWRIAMVIPMGALLVFVILFGIFAVEKPADKNLNEYIIKNPRHEKREEALRKRAKEDKKPWLYFLRLRNFWWWYYRLFRWTYCKKV